MADTDIPEFGAIFTFGKSRFADNVPSHFFIRNDPIVDVSCGDQHTAVVCTNGRTFVFGNNEWGQLGLGHRDHINKPCCVKTLKPFKVKHVACGRSHTLFSTVGGRVYACGYNSDGQLGIGDEMLEYVTQPTLIADIGHEISQIAAGSQHSAFLTEKGEVYSWGSNTDGQLGCGKLSQEIVTKPTLVRLDNFVSFITCGYYHTGIITEDHKLFVCGNNENYELGIDSNDQCKIIYTPIEITLPENVIFISFGGQHSIAVVESGLIYVCGNNSNGQLGLQQNDENNNMINIWTLLEFFKDFVITYVSCGDNHSMFITDKGELFVCGDTKHGKLCLSDVPSLSHMNITIPQKILDPFGAFNVLKVACGGCHSMIMAAPKPMANESLELDGNDNIKSSSANETEEIMEEMADTNNVEDTNNLNPFEETDISNIGDEEVSLNLKSVATTDLSDNKENNNSSEESEDKLPTVNNMGSSDSQSQEGENYDEVENLEKTKSMDSSDFTTANISVEDPDNDNNMDKQSVNQKMQQVGQQITSAMGIDEKKPTVAENKDNLNKDKAAPKNRVKSKFCTIL